MNAFALSAAIVFSMMGIAAYGAGSASDIPGTPKDGALSPREGSCVVVLPDGAYKQIKPGPDGSIMGDIFIVGAPNPNDTIQGTCTIYMKGDHPHTRHGK